MKNIVICGSMKIKDKLLEIKDELINLDYNVLLPNECFNNEPKIVASRAHFDRINNSDNEIVLVVNESKNGIENYIGPNTFAEIAFAFYFHKDVYLLNDIYEPYKDELEGWNIKTLKGNLNDINKQ